MKPKTLKITYWTVTILFSLLMLFSAVVELMQTKQANESLVHLGYPTYVNLILGVAKLAGIIAIIQWKFPTVKEWAYAGFTIDFLGAAASLFLSGDGIMVLSTLPFFLLLFISYLFQKTYPAP